jgi:hypothetical protein
MTHVNFTTSGVTLTDPQVARIREEIENTRFRSAWPNRIETWIQVQGRALNQAWRLLRGAALTVYKA